jgi:MGT family glycosyltransferase
VLPFARFTLPAVDKAVRAFQPDVLATDQHALAGALVANRYGLRWATLAPQSMELTQPLRGLPRVDAWVTDHLVRLWAEAGLPAGSYADPRFSPHLVLAFTGAALAGNGFAEHFALVGPALGVRPDVGDFDRARLLPGRRTVLVTMGTLASDLAADFYPRVMSALAPMEVQAVVVAPPEALADPPANVLVAPKVPVLDLMPLLDAVVCHGGLNTMCEALAHGIPVVVAPIKHDQPVNAAQVTAAGAGIRVHFGRCRPEQLRDALCAVLTDPAYRTAAGAIRDSFTAAGGASEAARRLAALAERS